MTKPNPQQQQQQQQQQEAPASATSETPTTHKTPVTSKGPATTPPARSTKRLIENLSPSPVSNETDLKKSKPLDSETLNQKVCAAQGMDYQSSEFDAKTRMDRDGLQEKMMSNMNSCFKDFQTYEVEGRGTSVNVNVFLQKVVPEIMKSMIQTCADHIDKTMNKWMERIEQKKSQEVSVLGEQFQAQVLRLKYENDANQQYSRRESVKIFGIKEEREEDVNKKAMDVLKDAGVEVVPEDFQAIHRNGPPRRSGDGPRPIMVKFVSRKKKQETMRKKKVLKEKEGYDSIYIHEDLTPLRSKLLKHIKDNKDGYNLKSAWTSEGKILCQPKYPVGLPAEQRPRLIPVETPDDLFHLGANRVDYKGLGLESYLFINNQ